MLTWDATGLTLQEQGNAAGEPVTIAITKASTETQATTGSPLTYKVQNAGAANGITFQPLYQVHHQRYSVYFPH